MPEIESERAFETIKSKSSNNTRLWLASLAAAAWERGELIMAKHVKGFESVFLQPRSLYLQLYLALALSTVVSVPAIDLSPLATSAP